MYDISFLKVYIQIQMIQNKLRFKKKDATRVKVIDLNYHNLLTFLSPPPGLCAGTCFASTLGLTDSCFIRSLKIGLSPPPGL